MHSVRYLGSSKDFYKAGQSPQCFLYCTAFLKPTQTSLSDLSSPLFNFSVAECLHFLSWELHLSSTWELSTHFPLFFHVLCFWMQITHPNHLSISIFQLILTSLVLGSICLERRNLPLSSHFISVYCSWICSFSPWVPLLEKTTWHFLHSLFSSLVSGSFHLVLASESHYSIEGLLSQLCINKICFTSTPLQHKKDSFFLSFHMPFFMKI